MTKSTPVTFSLRTLVFFLLFPFGPSSTLEASAAKAPPALLEIGTTKQLFVDSYIIEKLTDARQVLNQATKHPSNPVLKQDRPWERNLIQTGTVIWDQDIQRYRMWYYTAQYVVGTDRRGRVVDIPQEGKLRALRAYAVSKDGVVWEKPDLGFTEFQGSRKNNLLAEKNLTPAFLDPNEKIPDKRFKTFVNTSTTTPVGMKLDLYTSGDGFNWTAYENNPVIDTTPRTGRWGPTVWMGWDPIRKTYGVHMESCIHKNCPMRKRVIGRAESPDGIHWSEAQTMLIQDERDYPDTEFYAMAATTYADLYLGVITVFRTTNTRHYPELISSRDGIHYDREYREPFFPNGSYYGDFDDTSIYVFAAPIIRDGTMRIFYIGANWRGPDTLKEKGDRARRAIGLATIPADGIVSVDGGKLKPGILVTRLFSFQGKQLYVNMEAAKRNAGAGPPEVRVEVLDADHQPVGGFKLEEADPLTKTGRHRVSWGGNSDLSRLAGTPIQLKISIHNAKLYSFQFE